LVRALLSRALTFAWGRNSEWRQRLLHLVNEEGGVNGRKLKLVAYDDSYDPAKTETCFNRLMDDKVFALGFFVGTPTAVKYVPLAESIKSP